MTESEVRDLTLPVQVTWDDMGECIGFMTDRSTGGGQARGTLIRGGRGYKAGDAFNWGTYQMRVLE